MDDDVLLARFGDATLPEAAFGHREHVRIAWLCLKGATFEAGAARFCTGLRRFVASLGRADRYHETLTWAYLALVHERMQAQGTGPGFDAFATANADLFDRAGGALARLYDKSTLDSPLARRAFLLPRPAHPARPGEAPPAP